MIIERHIEADEAHHPCVVRSSAVECLVVAQEGASSNLVAPPMIAYRFHGERFAEPVCARMPAEATFPSIAQQVERGIEDPSVGGSNPSRGTGSKHKL